MRSRLRRLLRPRALRLEAQRASRAIRRRRRGVAHHFGSLFIAPRHRRPGVAQRRLEISRTVGGRAHARRRRQLRLHRRRRDWTPQSVR